MSEWTCPGCERTRQSVPAQCCCGYVTDAAEESSARPVEFAITIDDIFHFRGDHCCDKLCSKCSGRVHNGYVETYDDAYYITWCESCDVDEFRPAVRDDSVEGGHFL